MDSASVTSARTASARPPPASIGPATASSAARSRAASTTAAPAAANAWAVAAPMPRLAPATSATFPCMSSLVLIATLPSGACLAR